MFRLKPEQFNLKDENVFVKMAFHPKDNEKYKGFYIGLGIVAMITLSFFAITLTQLILTGGWPVLCFIGIPILIAAINGFSRLSQAKVISPYGVFITNRKGKVRRGFLWSEIKKVSYETTNSENGMFFKIIITPEKGTSIRIEEHSPALSACLFGFCFQQLPNGFEGLKQLATSFEVKKKGIFVSSEKQEFEAKLKELSFNKLTIQHVNEQKQLDLIDLLKDIKIHPKKH